MKQAGRTIKYSFYSKSDDRVIGGTVTYAVQGAKIHNSYTLQIGNSYIIQPANPLRRPKHLGKKGVLEGFRKYNSNTIRAKVRLIGSGSLGYPDPLDLLPVDIRDEGE